MWNLQYIPPSLLCPLFWISITMHCSVHKPPIQWLRSDNNGIVDYLLISHSHPNHTSHFADRDSRSNSNGRVGSVRAFYGMNSIPSFIASGTLLRRCGVICTVPLSLCRTRLGGMVDSICAIYFGMVLHSVAYSYWIYRFLNIEMILAKIVRVVVIIILVME